MAGFQVGDRDLAARILDCVEVMSEATIQQGYRDALNSLPGWHLDQAQREGRWFFTGFGGPSESGMAMLRIFREANNLNGHRYDALFCTISEFPAKKLTAEDTIVIVDDFYGTGQQSASLAILYELIARDARAHLVLTAATDDAATKISAETTLQVVAQFSIHRNENIFSSTCQTFNQADQYDPAVLREGRQETSERLRSCGLLYVLSPYNSSQFYPYFSSNHKSWKGLFPRNLQQSG